MDVAEELQISECQIQPTASFCPNRITRWPTYGFLCGTVLLSSSDQTQRWTGGGKSRLKNPGRTSAVLHEFFRSFRQPIKANTGTAACIELNPQTLPCTFFHTHSAKNACICCSLCFKSRIAVRILAKIYMNVTLLEATKIQYLT